jgi:hypothetical protein
MTDQISGTLLLDPEVIDDPYPFYAQLRAQPVRRHEQLPVRLLAR